MLPQNAWLPITDKLFGKLLTEIYILNGFHTTRKMIQMFRIFTVFTYKKLKLL